ncbi:uncharacterized protein [Choristoneura fumiferana]|uniref:uncharacterized protein n=1 Tax=Choristoneura fumiferana TaxID=7141 RepID=UPI003D154BB1
MDFVVGGIAGVGAAIFSNPFDVIKTRMQLQGELSARNQHAVHYKNIPHAMYTIVKHDGVTALQKGLVPALWFQLVVNGMRLGIYQHADNQGFLRDEKNNTKFTNSLVMGALSGMVGAFFGSPLQLVKTQLMSYSSEKIAVGTQHAHTGMTYAMGKIYQKNGLGGLWRGAHGMMIRNSIGSASQIASYAVCKEWMDDNDMFQQSKYLSAFVASNIGAVVKTFTLTPMDVIMTRLYNQAVDANGRGLLYSGIMDCARKITKTEGLLAFYKGMGPSYLRQAPHTVLLLVFWDMLKDLQKSLELKYNRPTMSLARDITDMGMGGASAMFATLFTNPIEVVKTRLQLQGELRTNHAVYYRSVPHGLYVIARNEGVVALQRGLSAMLGFQFFLNTFRLGMFRICERRGLTAGRGGRTSVVKGAAAAGAGGALGSVAGTPFFLVKTRLQAQAAKAISVGHQHKHTGTFEALADIYAKEGFKGLFRGVQPQIPRGAVGSASQMVSFSYAKESLVSRGWLTESPLLLSFCGANLGGLVMTVCLNPFDVVATRLSNQPVDVNNRGKLYSGMADCFYKMARTEGLGALYKGVGANYMRLGPHTVLLLVCWDQLKILEDFLRR